MPNPITTAIADLRAFADKVKADPTKYQAAIDTGKKGFESAVSFLDKLKGGDVQAAHAQLTEWEDVNKTLQAVEDMKAENAKGTGVTVDDVLDVVKVAAKVAQIVAPIALAAL